MADSWEMCYRGNLTNMTEASDSDQDGFSDVSEYRAGTDPTNSESLLKFTATNAWPQAGIVVRWLSASGKSYDVERATNLLSTDAFDSLAVTTSTPPLNVYTDTTAMGIGPFIYRIKLAP